MIKNIIRVFPIAFSCQITRYLFCNKIDVLKTYLEIIPPHRIYELKQNKQHTLQTALINLQKAEIEKLELNNEELKIVLKEVKKRTNMISLPILTRIAQLACRNDKSQYSIELRKAYTKIIRKVKNGAENLPLQQLIDMIYRLVKLNRKQYELMKEVQKVIIEDRIKIDYPLIRKILYSYTHMNQGSAVLYSHISKTLTIGQHQFRPVQLAESAYMLSKVSQNAKGGYGVFLLAEKHVEAALPRMSFAQLTKASSFLLTQDLGSNKFQIQLEQALYNTYPSKDRLKITDFVVLLKSTSGYFFKFKQNALLSILKTSTLRMTKFATLQQFEDIVWSWGRLGKGDKELWICLQSQIMRHLQQLKPRQLAFIYFSLCSTIHSSTEVLEAIQNKFMQTPLNQINQHYLIKFLLGMHKKKFYENQKFIKVSEIVSTRIQQLSNNQFLAFLKIMNQSDLDFSTKQQIKGVINSIKQMAKKLQSKLYTLKLTQITQLLYLMVKLQIDDNELIEKCFLNLDIIINIPKSAFIKSMFCFVMKEKYNKALEFVPIVEQLIKYGPIGYFFSPYDFPLFAYCMFHIAVNGTNITIKSQLLTQTETALRQINPVILNQFVRKGYSETINLIERYNTSQKQ